MKVKTLARLAKHTIIEIFCYVDYLGGLRISLGKYVGVNKIPRALLTADIETVRVNDNILMLDITFHSFYCALFE